MEMDHHSTMDVSTIGMRMRAVRKQAGLTLDLFAEAIDFSRRALINWEQDAAAPPVMVLAKLRQLYNVDPEWVLLGRDLEPRSYYGAIDWARLDRLGEEVDAACAEIGIDLDGGSRNQLARDLFECHQKDDASNRRVLRSMLAAIGSARRP